MKYCCIVSVYLSMDSTAKRQANKKVHRKINFTQKFPTCSIVEEPLSKKCKVKGLRMKVTVPTKTLHIQCFSGHRNFQPGSFASTTTYPCMSTEHLRGLQHHDIHVCVYVNRALNVLFSWSGIIVKFPCSRIFPVLQYTSVTVSVKIYRPKLCSIQNVSNVGILYIHV